MDELSLDFDFGNSKNLDETKDGLPWVPEPKSNKKKKIRKERKLALVKW